MFNTQPIEDIAKKLYAALPHNLQHIEQHIEQDIQQTFKEILQTAFAHLDLVTREEFDVQTKVLARTREKVDALEALLAERIIK